MLLLLCTHAWVQYVTHAKSSDMHNYYYYYYYYYYYAVLVSVCICMHTSSTISTYW